MNIFMYMILLNPDSYAIKDVTANQLLI